MLSQVNFIYIKLFYMKWQFKMPKCFYTSTEIQTGAQQNREQYNLQRKIIPCLSLFPSVYSDRLPYLSYPLSVCISVFLLGNESSETSLPLLTIIPIRPQRWHHTHTNTPNTNHIVRSVVSNRSIPQKP